MRTLLLATTNATKLARLRWVLDGLSFDLYTPADLPADQAPTIAEDGADFAANAAQKAQAWSSAAGGMLTLASDGGMAIPALGPAWDALRTRRNAGPQADDAGRIRHLLELMRDLHGEERRAYWHEALALARNGDVLQTWTASADGGLIVEQHPSGPVDDAWTESVRYYPTPGKLYRDLTVEELERLDGVWPRLRNEVRAFLEQMESPTSRADPRHETGR